MYQWKCLEKIAGGHHECSLLCILEDQGEKNKTSTAIEPQVHPLNNILFRLSDNLHSSDRTFDVPENGFESLATLLEGISQSVQRAEGKTASSEPPEATAPEFELRLASEATNAAAVTASAEAGAVGAATVAESVSAGQLLVSRAVAATLSAAGSAYQADGVGPSAAAGSLLSEVPFDNHGVASKDYAHEVKQWNNFCHVLFRDKGLGLEGPLYSDLSILGQRAIAQAASTQWDRLLEFLRMIKDLGTSSPLDPLLKLIQSGNQSLKALARQYLLASAPFKDLRVLEQVSRNAAAVELGLGDDADLRARNLRLRPDLFESGTNGSDRRHSGQECSVCAGEEEEEVVSGKMEDGTNDDFLTFPGKLNNVPIKPLIDTGGGCNLVKLEWIRSQGIEIDTDSCRFQALLMADGSESKSCPVIDVKWSFDGRNKAWVNVEFVVIEGYKYDALIGLPFLKHTETIHNSAGRLVFPEFKGVHAKKEAIPLYNFSKLKASK